MTENFLKRQVNDERETGNGPDTTSIRGAAIGLYVMVYRERFETDKSEWTGPFVVLEIDDRSETILGQYGPQTFRLSRVKRFFEQPPSQHESDDTATLPRTGP